MSIKINSRIQGNEQEFPLIKSSIDIDLFVSFE